MSALGSRTVGSSYLTLTHQYSQINGKQLAEKKESVKNIRLELYGGSQTADTRERHSCSNAGAHVNIVA
jgi:hypothetical protein